MRLSLASLLCLALCAGCAHRAPRAEGEEDGREQRGEQGAAKGGREADEGTPKSKQEKEREQEREKRAQKREEQREDKQLDAAPPLTLSGTTLEMFKPEGVKKLQRALQGKLDDLEEDPEDTGSEEAAPPEVKATGKLDGPTQRALRAFQKAEKMPETGLPDYETLRRLGVRPSEVFERLPTSERKGVR